MASGVAFLVFDWWRELVENDNPTILPREVR
jgi:hypothetical protein